jgi:histidinol dehydrogenase
MFAHGVPELCQRVDMITGPGNIYVVAAKRLLKGTVNIDAEAGPTEILVFAGGGAEPGPVAAAMISQAEHDPQAACSGDRIHGAGRRGAGRAPGQVAQAKHSERIGIALGGVQVGLVLVDDLAQGLEVVNGYAPEHLEIQTAILAQLPRGFAMPAPSSSARGRRCRSATIAPAAPMCCQPVAVPATALGSTKSFLKAVHVISYDREALAEGGAAGRGLRRRGGLCRHTAPRSAADSRRSIRRNDGLIMTSGRPARRWPSCVAAGAGGPDPLRGAAARCRRLPERERKPVPTE